MDETSIITAFKQMNIFECEQVKLKIPDKSSVRVICWENPDVFDFIESKNKIRSDLLTNLTRNKILKRENQNVGKKNIDDSIHVNGKNRQLVYLVS
jgi:hypothetical protein